MKSILAAAVFCLLSGAVHAKPASGDLVDTPCSAQPNNLVSGRGQVSQDNEDNSVRQTAPSPNLAK